MTIVTTIRPGHRIKTDADTFTVMGSTNIRGRYCYTVANAAGRKFSLSRDDVLEAQRDGSAKVMAA